MSNEIKIAFIGAGKIAREHLKVFNDIAGVKLSGIYSRTASKAEQLSSEFKIQNVCKSIKELYKTTNADLVVVTVNVESMLEVGLECMKYPWTILLEKPAGINLTEAEQLLEESTIKKSKVYTGLNRRFYSSTQSVLSDIKKFDAKRYIHVTDNQNIEAARALGFNEKVLDYWMYANSIHLIDYFKVFGRGKITGVAPLIKWSGRCSRVVLIKLEFDNGDIGLYEGIWQGPGRWSVEINTPERRWEMKPLEEAAFQNSNERSLNKFEISESDKKFKPGLRLQAEEIIKAVKGGTTKAVTLEDSLETMKLIKMVFGV